MKIVCSLLIGICCSFGASAQRCDGFPMMQQGRLLSITNYNRTGAGSGKVVQQVMEVKNALARIHSVVFDAKGNVISDGTSFAQCMGAHFRVGIHLILSQLPLRQLHTFNGTEDQFVEYPLLMKPGEMLRDARYALQSINSQGVATHLEIAVENRTVTGEEMIETPAGSRNCYKIVSHITLRTQVRGMTLPLSVDNTEWFSPELGIVKNEAKSYRSELTSID